MKEFEVALKAVVEGLRTIAQGVEKIAEKLEKAAPKEKPAPKAKAKPGPKAKKAAEKKAPAKKAPKAKRTATKAKTKPAATAKAVPKAKKAPAKKVVKETAADTVLKIIAGSKKGVNSATLMEKTGFDKKKSANIVFKLRKQGKIKSVDPGVAKKFDILLHSDHAAFCNTSRKCRRSWRTA